MPDIINGNTLIILALPVSLAGLFFAGRAALGKASAAGYSRQLYFATTALIVLSCALLMGLLLAGDYRNAYVYNNISSDLPTLYVVAAFWAGHQGSFLLWLLLINLVGIFIMYSKDDSENILMPVLLITQIFFLAILVADSPFKMVWDAYADVQPGFKPENGLGMNSLLVDPWMVSHPPVLFLGYASAIVPFGYAITALIRRDATILVERAYPWVLFSMICLGMGIFMGGYWAYKVLGWGGYWGWDPVENSSLIPWLVSIALVHGIVLQRKKGVLARSNIALSLVYFILVYYGTFLTRSGVLSDFSVHSFADYGLSPYLASFLCFYIIIAAVMFAVNGRKIESKNLSDSVFSWDALAGYGVLVLVGFAAVVLAGTSMPIISGLFMDKASAVTEHFYNNISVPFGMLMLVFMVGSTMSLTGMKLTGRTVIASAAVSLAAGVAFNLPHTVNPIPYFFTVLSLFVVIMCGYDLARLRTSTVLASRLTHMGMAILVIGIMASGYHSSSVTKTFVKDKEESVFSFFMTFRGMTGENKTALHFSLRDDGVVRDIYTPYYPDEKTSSWFRAPYVVHEFSRDVYISPEAFHSGIQEASSIVLAKDGKGKIGDLTVHFRGFRTENMTSAEPQIIADLAVNGKPVAPALKIVQGSRISIDKPVPGTDRAVSIADIDVGERKVMLSFTLGRNAVIPPDSAVAGISLKRFIWLVWLGTIVISAGCIAAFARVFRNSPA